MMKDQNIICFANDWDADPTSKHQILKVLARSNRVLWINSIGLRQPMANLRDISRIINKVAKFWRGALQAETNLNILTPLAIPYHGVPGVSSINAWMVSRHVKTWVKKLRMEPFQLWTFIPTSAPLVCHLKPQKVIYYCVDEWSEFSFLDSGLMRRMEANLIAQSDLVITSAVKLYVTKRLLHPNTHLISHGVDTEHFSRALLKTTRIAPELEGLPHPIIGFWGSIHEWIDAELIEHVARRKPEWSIVLVGNIDIDCGNLERLPNVHLLGRRSYQSLPEFAKGFTVSMLPFKINHLTENVNPIKLREYLASGLPIVSTALPEVAPYAEVVRIGRNPDEFIQHLEVAVHETDQPSVNRRIAAVSQENWYARVEYLSKLIDEIPTKSDRKSSNFQQEFTPGFKF